MATRRLAQVAAGGSIPAAIAASSAGAGADCEGSASLSASFDVISQAEIDEVTRELAKEGAAGSPSSLSGSLSEMRELGNGWLAADDETSKKVIALGRDLAGDPRVQAAVMDRVRDPLKLAASSTFVDELKLVLVARGVAPDGELSASDCEGTISPKTATPGTTTPTFWREAGSQTGLDGGDVQDDEDQSADTLPAYDKTDDVRPEEVDAKDEPNLTMALIEAALIVAAVVVMTVVAKRFNAKAAALAASALAGVWSAIIAPFHARKS